jgi:hypothetical protein
VLHVLPIVISGVSFWLSSAMVMLSSAGQHAALKEPEWPLQNVFQTLLAYIGWCDHDVCRFPISDLPVRCMRVCEIVHYTAPNNF